MAAGSTAGDNWFMLGGLWAPGFTRNPSLKVIDLIVRQDRLPFPGRPKGLQLRSRERPGS